VSFDATGRTNARLKAQLETAKTMVQHHLDSAKQLQAQNAALTRASSALDEHPAPRASALPEHNALIHEGTLSLLTTSAPIGQADLLKALRADARSCAAHRKRTCTWFGAALGHIGWHVLRHTFASHLVMKGATLKAVQELLGHADIRMTMRYAHLSASARREAVELLDRGQYLGNGEEPLLQVRKMIQ
jgi:hypothetical protein